MISVIVSIFGRSREKIKYITPTNKNTNCSKSRNNLRIDIIYILLFTFKFFVQMNIFLIGMMGSGKSSVGQSLSKYLNNTFYDLDKEIEKSFNLSIKDIFLEYGEDLFRKEEEKLLGELNKLSGLIVSTGGGIVISNVNRTILKKNKTYFLEANIEDMYERALRRENDRPILKGMNVTQFKDLYEKRRNLYIESATKIINVEKKSTEDLVIEIVNNEKNII